jgi:hypothetical protein
VWPMDGHGRCANARDDGGTARATSCHSSSWRGPLSVCAMMARRGADASPVPHASLDASNRSQLFPTPWPRLAKDRRLPSPSCGSPSNALARLLRFCALVSPHGMLPGRGQGQLLAQFVLFFVPCMFVQTCICLRAFVLH